MDERYDQLAANAANYVPLSPLTFLARAAQVHPDRTALIHGRIKRSWSDVYRRARRLASALRTEGVGLGDTVAIMAPNIPALYEAHFGVPMAGAVLNAINTRLDAKSINVILGHGGAKVLLTDSDYAGVVRDALVGLDPRPVVIDICDPEGPWGAGAGEVLGETDYEAFLERGDPEGTDDRPADEWQAIALNYTSGTTGNPKGVVYHHRGAYLNAMGNIVAWAMRHHPVYLWTLPMFHCNGWCFPWTIAALAGTNVCLRQVTADAIYKSIATHRVTHLCGAPIIMQMMIDAPERETQKFEHQVSMMTAAAPPPASVLAAMTEQGIAVTHVYGLTECYGPGVVCDWQDSWDELPADERARQQARQGVAYPVMERLMVADPQTLEPVPQDGETLGEVFMRGNILMKGYLGNPTATETAFAGGWFHTGDLGVWYPDSYVELKDRSKDIIISGGENISSIEVEGALYEHPEVAVAAVVAKQDEKWGETPCAFVELKLEAKVTEAELLEHCRASLAHYKCPRHIVFGPVPKTSTGKIQKYLLRQQANAPTSGRG